MVPLLKDPIARSSAPVKTLPTEEYFALVRQTLSEQGRAFVRVTGNSMRPLLRHIRDGVVIVPLVRVRRGDIVLFDRGDGRYALHRVIRAGKDGFVMAGDSQWYLEKDLPYGQIVGVAGSVVRGGRSIPCENVFLRIYGFLVTLFAFPRIWIRQQAIRLLKAVRRKGNRV